MHDILHWVLRIDSLPCYRLQNPEDLRAIGNTWFADFALYINSVCLRPYSGNRITTIRLSNSAVVLMAKNNLV